MPQEIDGKGGVIPPLCRNRDVLQPLAEASAGMPACGKVLEIRLAMHRPIRHQTMNKTIPAPPNGAFRVVLVLALAGCCTYAQASPVPTEGMPEVELAPVTVSAHDGLAVPYDQTGVSVTVLDIPELKKEGIYTLSEAMTTVPGVFALPGGGLNQRGNVNNVCIRGMRGAQTTLPMMDGMRLYSASNGMNLTPNIMAHTNLFALGSAEVLRGAQGAVYGSGALGGVVCMETPEGKGEPSLTLFNEAGSFDSYTGHAAAQGQVDKLGYYVSVTYDRTNNDIEYADHRPVTQKHAGRYEAWHEAVRLDYAVNDDNKLTMTYRREDADLHSATAGESFSLYRFRSNLVTAKWQTCLNESWSSSLMAGYYGVDHMFGHGNNPNLRNAQIEWRNAYRWNDTNTTTAGFAWNRSDYRCRSSWEGAELQDTLDNTYSFFVEHTFTPAKNWDNSLALRWDHSSVYDGFLTFRAATNYRFNQEKTRVFASVGNGYQTPYALQRSGYYEYESNGWKYRYVGNPDLDCTRSISVDFGVEQEIACDHYVSATAFWSRLTDGINTVDKADYYTFANSNTHWTVQGLELSLHGTWEKSRNTGYKVSYTMSQPEDGSDRQLAETSRHLWSAEIHTSPTEKLTVGAGLAAAAGRTDWKGGKLDAYYILRCYARYQVNEHLAFHLRIENLTGQKFIADSNGNVMYDANWNPTPGFGTSVLNSGAAVYGGCTLTF